MKMSRAIFPKYSQIPGSAQIHLVGMKIMKELGIVHFVGVKEENSLSNLSMFYFSKIKIPYLQCI